VQTSAPLPQDVHPQAYQATGAVGPPGPQWGNPTPQPPPPPQGPSANGWGSRLAEINPPPQPPNPYDPRDPARGPVPAPRGPPSPRADQLMRPYPGQGTDNRAPPPPSRRTPPREHHPAMGPYPGTGLPQPQPPTPQLQPQGPPPSQPQRVSNPNYAGPSVLPPAPTGVNGSTALPPFGRGGSPRPEVRPLIDNRMASPKPGYPHQYHHPDISNPGGIEGGAPAPASALAAAEAAAVAGGRDAERPPSVGPKRMREWEEEPSLKKPASDENRARMEDMHHRRPSTPSGEPFRRSASEAQRIDEQRRVEEQRRTEDQRRANENYHPSEAAHHPPTHGLPPNQLPSLQQGAPPVHTPIHELPPPPPQPTKEFASDERERERERSDHPPPTPVGEPERAARKIDVDEDYDDDAEDDKKASIIVATSAPGPSPGEPKASSPTGVNGHANGLANGQPKIETSA
jgi:glucose repression mediator protein